MISARITYGKINSKNVANNLLHMFKFHHDKHSKSRHGENFWKAIDEKWPKQQVEYLHQTLDRSEPSKH